MAACNRLLQSPGVVRLGGVVAVVISALVLGAGAAGAPHDREYTSVRQIVENPERFYGKTVRFEARVSRWIDHRVWEMADGRLFVIKNIGVDPAPRPPEVMRVIGKVRRFTPEAIEQRAGVNIEEHFFTDDFLQDDVAVVAQAVLRVDWPVPLPDWFWVWARWYLDRGEFAEDDRVRSGADRPDAAPYPIPDWAWHRLQPIIGGW